MKRGISRIRRQNRFLYAAIRALLRPYLWLRYGFSPPKTIFTDDSPVLVLGNHTCNLDFLFAVTTLYPKLLNIVVSSFFFNHKGLARLLRFFQCVKKQQFRADVAAIRDMRRAIACGGSILLYPEGEVSGIGVTDTIPPNTAHLCRLLGVSVYGIRVAGGLLTRPKWGRGERRGRITAELIPIATKDELNHLDDAALHARITGALRHDEYAWQRERMIPFRGKALAEGLHNLLYLCPKCGREYAMRTSGNEIFCIHCHNRGILDVYGFLSPKGKDDVIPRDPAAWVHLEREALRRAIATEGFFFSEPCALELHKNSRSLAHTAVGHGVAVLDGRSIRYDGSCEGEAVHLEYPLDNIIKLPFDSGRQFDIPNPEQPVSIRPDIPGAVEKFVLAVPIIRSMYT